MSAKRICPQKTWTNKQIEKHTPKVPQRPDDSSEFGNVFSTTWLFERHRGYQAYPSKKPRQGWERIVGNIVINTMIFEIDAIMLNFRSSYLFVCDRYRLALLRNHFQLGWQTGPTYFQGLQTLLRSLLQKYVAPEVQTGKETCNFFLGNQLWIKYKNTLLIPEIVF